MKGNEYNKELVPANRERERKRAKEYRIILVQETKNQDFNALHIFL